MIVDFTAKWCITCNSIVKPALERETVIKTLEREKVVALLADYTAYPPEITEELARFNRAGVPLVLVYPKDKSQPPVVLPQDPNPLRDAGAVWLMKDSVAGTVRKLRDGAGGTVGAFLWAPSLTQGVIGGQPDRFLGYPVYTDPNMAAAGSGAVLAVFGDPSQYVVRTVGNPVIETSADFRISTDQTSFRGKWSVGGNHTAKSHVNSLVQNV